MARKATASEISRLLRERPSELRRLLGEPGAQLSLPTDRKGVRVLARLPHAPSQQHVTVEVLIGDETVEVLVQLSGDFERVRALRSPWIRAAQI